MKLVVSDLSNIEGRVLAWLAGEEWKLQAFRDYDAGTGPDLYNITACSIIGGDPWNTPKKVRNVFGKVPELALGFEGGVGAFQRFAKDYRVRMADHWGVIKTNIPDVHIQYAELAYEHRGKDSGIDRTEWIASESVKNAWRARNPKIRSLWGACKDAVINAIRYPGAEFRAGPFLRYQVVDHISGRWLLGRLPSGKYMTYYNPRVVNGKSIVYEGYGEEDTTSRVWTDVYTYGGKTAQGATQAVAGDVLKSSKPVIEAAGYELLFSVHDEDVTQAPDSPLYSHRVLSRMLATVPPWAEGLPLAAAGFDGYRYKKED